MIYDPIPIICAGLQPKDQLLPLAWDVHQLLATIHRGDGDARNADVRVLDKPTLLTWAATSPANYRWLAQLGAELCNQYAKHNSPARLNCETLVKGKLSSPPAGMKVLPWRFTSPEEHV